MSTNTQHTPGLAKVTAIALLSPQGTACAETALYSSEDTPFARARIEAEFCDGSPDAPIPGTWTDVSENDAIAKATGAA